MNNEAIKKTAWGRNARPSPIGDIVHDEGLSGDTYIRSASGAIEVVRGIPMNDHRYIDIPSDRDDIVDDADDAKHPH